MPSVYERQAADKLGPLQGQIAVLDVTSTSTAHNILAAGGKLIAANGRFVELLCDKDVVYFWSADALATVSPTATTGLTQGFLLPAGLPEEHVPPAPYLIVRVVTGAPGRLRIAVTSGTSRQEKY